MRNKKKKVSAYMGMVFNKKGFTMLSMLIAISMMVLLFPLITSVLKTTNLPSSYDELSVRQFFVYFRDEMITAKGYQIHSRGDEITLDLADDRQAVFLLFGKNIVRRIDGGHEIYLRDVHELTFEPLSYGVRVQIIIEGATYEKEIVLYQ